MGEGSGRDLTEGLFFVFLNFFRAASPPVESLGKMRGGGPGEGRRKPFSIKVPSPLPHTPSSHPPKIFDWWGGCAEGVRSDGKKKTI